MCPGTPGHGVCVCVYIYVCCCMVVVGLEVVPNETRQCVACCLLRLCYTVTAECMFLTGCMMFTTWLSFFLAQFPLPHDGLLSILSKFLVQGTSVQMGTSPFFPILCSKTHAPSPVEDCGVPSTKARVGQYQGMCALMAGWIHEPTQSLDPHLACTYVNALTQSQSQRIGILEDPRLR